MATRKPPRKSTQYEFIKSSMELLAAKGEVTIETPEPRKIKEALSRYKQENNFAGQLFFTCETAGFTNGHMMYKLTVNRVPT